MDGNIQERVNTMIMKLHSIGTGLFILYMGWTLFLLFMSGGHVTASDFEHVFGLILSFWTWCCCAYLVYLASQKVVAAYREARKIVTQRIEKSRLPTRMEKPVRKEDSQTFAPIKPQEVFNE